MALEISKIVTGGSLDPDVRAHSPEFQDDSIAIDRNCVPYRIHSRYECFIELVDRQCRSDGTLGLGIETLGVQKPQIATLFAR